MNRPEKKYPSDTRFAAHGLSCRRGGRMVFEGVSFDVGLGDYLHIRGKNGSGKSTLLRLVAGLLPAYGGELTWAGQSVLGALAAESEAMTYSGHQHGLKSVLTLRENASNLFQLMTGQRLDNEKLEEAADQFGLIDLVDQPLKYFSSGQTHRCALLRFLLIDRPIWLMDEPTVGLDTENRAKLEQIMTSHLAAGGIILAASHDPISIEGKELDLAKCQPSNAHLEAWL